ncbi:RNA-directed DNA polymerase (Reverse transcriptase), partial [Ectothiorhodospira sp. PHS-1]|uniref:group II intron maturase-specific domain-containing protein n=2 Tax=Gammaproteobacteria TaxID=1236 RepID=UPI00024A851E
KLARLDRYIRGWASYFRLAKTHRLFADLDGWIRSRLRMCLMKQWFKPRTRVRKMIELGLPVDEARGYSQHKRW